MNNSRIWLFRGLVVLGLGLLLVSWFTPWWSISVDQIGADAAIIHPWGLETQLRESEKALIAGADMPDWFAPFVFTYLGIVVVALVASLFLNGRDLKLGSLKVNLQRWFVLGVGLSYIGVVVICYIVASMKASSYFGGVNLVGYTYIDLGEPYQSGANAGFLIGYYLGCVVGPYLVLIALLRNKIIGEPKAMRTAPAPMHA